MKEMVWLAESGCVKKGRKDMAARANERSRDILAGHEVPPLPEAAEEMIAEVLKERPAARR